MNANITIPAVILMCLFSVFMMGGGIGIYLYQNKFPRKLTIEAVKVLIIMLVEMLFICAWNYIVK